jgi:hypothetical protein
MPSVKTANEADNEFANTNRFELVMVLFLASYPSNARLSVGKGVY